MRRIISIVVLILSIASCSTNNNSGTQGASVSPVNMNTLYLRGVFNWWEALPAYQFSPLENGVWTVDVELIADGQPYDFRLSDEHWTPSQSCGGAIQSQPIMLGAQSILVCKQSSQNLQFTPAVTAVYRFEVSQPKRGSIVLKVSRR